MYESTPIETERLLLRPVEAGDYDALYSYVSRPDVTRWLYWDAHTPDQARATLERRMAARTIAKEGDGIILAMVLRSTGEMIGDVDLEYLSEQHRQGEIGFIVHPDHHGHGYATEAGRVLLRIAFEDLKLHRVVGRAEARNTASARVLEKLGLRREALLVENEWVKGEWQSEVVYAIIDREWRAEPQPHRDT